MLYSSKPHLNYKSRDVTRLPTFFQISFYCGPTVEPPDVLTSIVVGVPACMHVVTDLGEEIERLREKGVSFDEVFDLPGGVGELQALKILGETK